MSLFPQTSAFAGGDHKMQYFPTLATPKLSPKTAAKTREIDNKTLEDWAHRLEQCAYEAEDEKLLPLYSDLLDLRDEVVALLHKNL